MRHEVLPAVAQLLEERLQCFLELLELPAQHG